ncbi:hypothetical protein HanRHA438_Chr14g0667691 [Helianthus annuus]|nr:hypothetical protein HanRHA438_Chr14g0667691 [Helianthus annuus]
MCICMYTNQRYRRCSKQEQRSCHRKPMRYQGYQHHHTDQCPTSGQSGPCSQ